jgi:hypothetical protein
MTYICSVIKQRNDKAIFPGIAMLIMLFFLVISSPSDTPVNRLNDSLKFELISEFHSSPLSADIVQVINLPAFDKKWVTSQDKLSFMVYDQTLKIRSDNLRSAQKLSALQKEEFVTKQIVFYKFYYHMFSLVSSELPSLS